MADKVSQCHVFTTAGGSYHLQASYFHHVMHLNGFHVDCVQSCFQPLVQKRKRPWAAIDSDVWVKCSVRQMNSDSMFITLLHTALHTHAVFKINKQPSFHLPLSWTKIDLTLQIHWLPATNHSTLSSSLLEMTPQMAQRHMILTDENKWIETYHSFHRDEIGIHGDDPEFDFKRKKKKCITILYFQLLHKWIMRGRRRQRENDPGDSRRTKKKQSKVYASLSLYSNELGAHVRFSGENE